MKKIILLCFFLFGCESATVLSNDGAKYLGVCNELNWVECVNKKCPNGYDIVANYDLIKCKP